METAEYNVAAKFYDLEFKDVVEDIPFYVDYSINQGSPVLELGCGTGRVLIPIAEAGLEAWGIDVADEMLLLAKEKIARLNSKVAERIHLIKADMRDFTLPKKFKLIIIPFATFLHMKTKEDKEKTLRKIREHLDNNGLLIIDIFAPHYQRLTKKRDVSIKEIEKEGQKIVVTTFNQYDYKGQLIHISKFYDVLQPNGTIKRFIQKFTISYIFRYEMEHLLEKEGFKIVNIFGGYDKRVYDYESGKMIFIAKKA